MAKNIIWAIIKRIILSAILFLIACIDDATRNIDGWWWKIIIIVAVAEIFIDVQEYFERKKHCNKK